MKIERTIYTKKGLRYLANGKNFDENMNEIVKDYDYNDYHNEDGPAYIVYYDDVLFYEGYKLNGKRHRIDGPANIWYNKDGSVSVEYYRIKGQTYTKEGWEKHPEVQEFLKNKAFDETMKEILNEV